MTDGEEKAEDSPAVWPFEGHPGYRRAIESAGAVAAPLLAGFAFTLFVLVLPTLNGHRTPWVAHRGAEAVTEPTAFSGVPELAAGFLLLAGVSLVFSVQAAINLRYHNHRPAELAEWYPEYFPLAQATVDAPAPAERLGEWSTEDWPAVRIGEQWYGGWPRHYLHQEIVQANKSAKWMRWLYHLGILCLLMGVTALVWPPSGAGNAERWALVAIGAAGVIVEAIWISAPLVQSCRRRLSPHRHQPAD